VEDPSAAEKFLPRVAGGVVLPEQEVLHSRKEDHKEGGGKQEAAGDQTGLFFGKNGDGGVDIDDRGARVDQGHEHQQVLEAEYHSLSKVLTPHLLPPL